ncbi:MAG: hypothetical protein ACKVUS_08490 [Saprospiraceae bacterium]
MKKKTNRQIFEDLPSEAYFKSVEKAAKIFRDMAQHVGSLGFDEETNGFLALHRRHAPSGFEQEIPVCVFLKKLGFGVVLAEEFPHRKSADAEIDGVVFEIKQVAQAKNILRAIRRQFRTAYHKCDNLLLHIAQPITATTLRSALSSAIKTYPSVKLVWVVFNNVLYQFDRKQILSGDFRIATKK